MQNRSENRESCLIFKMHGFVSSHVKLMLQLLKNVASWQ